MWQDREGTVWTVLKTARKYEWHWRSVWYTRKHQKRNRKDHTDRRCREWKVKWQSWRRRWKAWRSFPEEAAWECTKYPTAGTHASRTMTPAPKQWQTFSAVGRDPSNGWLTTLLEHTESAKVGTESQSPWSSSSAAEKTKWLSYLIDSSGTTSRPEARRWQTTWPEAKRRNFWKQ